jgi:hypothetical protein
VAAMWKQCEVCFFYFDENDCPNFGKVYYNGFEIGTACRNCQFEIWRKKKMNLIEIVKPIWDKWSLVDNSINTYCNLFICDVMLTQNYHRFEGRVANTIIDIIEFEKWKKIEPKDWKQDSIVIAAQKDEPHGHVCILLPGDFIQSGKWNKLVPLCANIGKDNYWLKGTNFVFRTEPTYFQFA